MTATPAAEVEAREEERIRCVMRCGEADTGRDSEFEDLARLSAEICAAPIAFVSLIDRDRQWFKGSIGFGLSGLPREVSFCAHTIRQGEPLVVEDSLADDRFRDNPMIRAANLRFYAGIPLIDSEGHALGTLAVSDRKPRRLEPGQLTALRVLASQATAQLELRARLQELEEARAELEESQRVARIGSWSWDPEAGEVTTSPALRDMVGIPADRDRLSYEEVVALIEPDDRTLADGLLRRHWDRGEQASRVARVSQAEAPPRALLARAEPMFGEDGAVLGVRGTAQDVTDVIESERYRDAQYEVTRVLATAEDVDEAIAGVTKALGESTGWAAAALWLVDPDAQIMRCHRHWHAPGESLPGLAESTEAIEFARGAGLPGMAWESGEPVWHALLPSPDPPNRFRGDDAFRAGLRGALCFPLLSAGKVIGAIELGGRRPDRPPPELLELLSSLGSQIGQFIDRHRAAADAAALERQLQQTQRLDAVGQLAGGIAHDFNNLLGVILNYADFALEAAKSETVKAELEEIRIAAERATELTNQLLLVSRGEGGTAEAIEINPLISAMETLLRRALGDAIELRLELAEGLRRVNLTPRLLEQVVLNLALNARDAMPGGGQLRIETENADAEVAGGSALGSTEGGHVRIVVSDTGAGMSPEVADRAFEPFFTTKDRGAGTGLGLATVYGIVQRAGGEIEIDTAPGRGTRISLALPATSGATDRAGSVPADALPASKAGKVVLLVDDEDAVRRLARRILERGGFAVLEAGSAEEAVAQWDRCGKEVDVLLTDVVMPRQSGVRLQARLREERPGLKVIYMSGYAGDLVSRHGDIQRDRHFLEKPFTSEELLESVRSCLAG